VCIMIFQDFSFLPPSIQESLELVFLGNSVALYVEAVILFLVLYLFLGLIQNIVLVRLRHISKKTETDIDDFVIQTISSIKPRVYFYLSFYIGVQRLALDVWLGKTFDALVLFVVVYQVVYTVGSVMEYLFDKRFKEDEVHGQYAARFVGGLVKWSLWVVGVLLIIQNLGINVTSLIAGLGIGGVAIAFALQNVLGDLFASLAIYLDKPFIVGDIIKVGDYVGEVEKIGIKTTRVRSLIGEEVVFSNSDLLSSRIQNFKKLEKRRVVFSLDLVYETPPEVLKTLPDLLREIVEGAGTEFGRAHFKVFKDSAISFEVVYFVESGDYDTYVHLEHTINTKIHEVFKEKGIEFAYPTALHYNKNLS